MPATVLIVDDEPLVRLSATHFLEASGFLTLSAQNADEAWDLLQASPQITILFTDIQMPGSMDGVGLAARARVLRPNLEIVVTSGGTVPEPNALPAGVVFLQKPYDLIGLAPLLERMARWS